MNGQKVREGLWDTYKTCGELSCDECNDRFEKLQLELASKQKEIDSWKIVAENWRVDAVDWSRRNKELESSLHEQQQNQLDLLEVITELIRGIENA